MPALSYPAEQVRLYDHDRFLTAILAPAAVREDLFALYAFNLEIAKTGELVREPMMGRMRLQWWRDAVDRLYAGGDIAHGVVRPLRQAIVRHDLPRSGFEHLIDAREADLDQSPPPNMQALLAYAEATAASLLDMAAHIAMKDPPPAATEAAKLVGTAWALIGLLRAVPFHARRRRLHLPADRLAAANIRVARLFDLKPEPGLHDIVREIAGQAAQLLRRAAPALRQVPRNGRSPFLLAALGRIYLSDLRRAGWDPFALERRHHPFLVARLAANALSGWY